LWATHWLVWKSTIQCFSNIPVKIHIHNLPSKIVYKTTRSPQCLNETITSQKETQEMKRSWRFDHLIQLTNPPIVGYTLQVGPRTSLFVLQLGFKPLGLQGKVILKVFFFSLKSKKVSVIQWFYICIACAMLSALLPEVLNQYVTCNNWNFTRSAYIVNLNSKKCRRTYLPVIGVLLLGRESSNRPWYTSSKGLFPTCWESHKKTPNIFAEIYVMLIYVMHKSAQECMKW
jgi:hypothetical protein